MIGCGEYAMFNYIPELLEVSAKKHTDINLFVCRRDQKKLKHIVDAFGIVKKGYSDFSKMLKNENLDGVIVSTPHKNHLEHAKECIDFCDVVLVDKPLTTNVEDTKKLIRLSKEKGKVLIPAHEYCYKPMYMFMRNEILEENLGKIKAINASMKGNVGVYFMNENRWYSKPEISGGGMLLGITYHLIYVINWLINSKASEVFTEKMRFYKQDIDIASEVLVKYENDTEAIFYSKGDENVSPLSLDINVTIAGEKGKIDSKQRLDMIIENGMPKFNENLELTYTKGNKQKIIKDFPKQTSSPLLDFINCLKGSAPLVSPLDALETNIIIKAAYNSANFKKLIKITRD